MRVVFQEVSYPGIKTGKCTVCNKTVTRRKKFWSTINPFNKNNDGTVKNYDQVREQVFAKRREWMDEPIKHVKCEGK